MSTANFYETDHVQLLTIPSTFIWQWQHHRPVHNPAYGYLRGHGFIIKASSHFMWRHTFLHLGGKSQPTKTHGYKAKIEPPKQITS